MKRVTVSALRSSRYTSGSRPLGWEGRIEGIDTITTSEDEELTLFSDGQQSPPQPGWTILLMEKVSEESLSSKDAYRWTLCGMSTV